MTALDPLERGNERTLVLVFLLGEPLCEGLYATVILWAILALVASSAFEASFASATDTPEKTIPRARTHPEPMMGKCFHPPSTKRVIPPPPIGDEKIFTDAPNPDAGHKE